MSNDPNGKGDRKPKPLGDTWAGIEVRERGDHVSKPPTKRRKGNATVREFLDMRPKSKHETARHMSYSLAWEKIVERKSDQQIADETGLPLGEILSITMSKGFIAHSRNLMRAIGTVREAALKRYRFEVEGLVEQSIKRIEQILADPDEKSDVVLKAACAVLDRAGVSAPQKVDATVKFELPESTLKRIEEAARDMPLVERDTGEWEYATEKPKIRFQDSELDTEPKDEPV